MKIAEASVYIGWQSPPRMWVDSLVYQIVSILDVFIVEQRLHKNFVSYSIVPICKSEKKQKYFQ